MSNINNKLISVFAILAFVFGLSLASPVYARTAFVESGVNFIPTTYAVDNINTYNQTQSYNTNNNVVIPGCEGRNTGFSNTTGQSCVGNYVGNTNTSNTTTYNRTNTTSTKTAVKNYDSTNTTVVRNVDTSNNNVATASDINESYGSLTANALLGSNSVMPTGLVQWIFFIILIIAIIFLWRYVHRSEEVYMAEPMKHA